MRQLFALTFLALFSASASAQEISNDCAAARDPVRCEARQAALKTCADKRGSAKAECLELHMPPLDCAKHSNPAKCEAIQRAKDVCAGKEAKALKQCLKDEGPKKVATKTTKKAPKKSAKKANKKKN